ncbi:MAG: apolipoprotein N-acyltransferase [Granulosicoccaceae bacterium]
MRCLKYLIPLIAGGIYPLAFAPTAIRPLALVSLVVFWLCLRNSDIKLATRQGWLFGVGMFGVGVNWIYHSLHLFGQAIAPLSFVGAAGFVAVIALYPALFAWVQARYFQRTSGPIREAMLLPVLWFSLEWFRQWFLVGFPWLQLGYAGLDTPLEALAPWGGVLLVTLVASFLAGSVAVVVAHRSRVSMMLALGVLLIVSASLLSSGAKRWGENVGGPISVRMVQGNIEQGIKFEAQHLVPSLQKYADLSLTDDKPVDLLIWPETAVPIYFEQAGVYLQPFRNLLIKNGTHWLMGGFSWREDSEQTFNTVRVATLPEPVDYHKRNLVPFGEYMPFRWVLDFLRHWIAIPMSDISAGRGEPRPLPVGELLAAVSICYDDAFGAEVIRQLPDAHFLVNVSNDAWFGQSWAPEQHQEIARMRALETDRHLLRSTNTGVTSSIDRHGKVLESAVPFEAAVLDTTVQPRQGETSFVRWGNKPLFVVLLLLWVCVVWIERRCARR